MFGPGTYAIATAIIVAWLCHLGYSMWRLDAHRTFYLLTGGLVVALVIAVITVSQNSGPSSPPLNSPAFTTDDIEADRQYWDAFGAAVDIFGCLICVLVIEPFVRAAIWWRLGRLDATSTEVGRVRGRAHAPTTPNPPHQWRTNF